MSDKSRIEWTDATWNPVTGCTKVSDGCKHCYAERRWVRLAANKKTRYFGRKFTDVQCHEDVLTQPLRWQKPRRIFVNSMSDLFHPDVPFSFIDEVFGVMAGCSQHTFQVLTKRAERMREYLGDFRAEIAARDFVKHWPVAETMTWPLPNVWLGVSVEDQAAADYRIPFLLDTPAAVRWVSAEPLLGPVDLRLLETIPACISPNYSLTCDRLHWVVAGGESGPKARPMHPDWARSLRDQCADADVPFLFKQWGEWAPNWLNDDGGQKVAGSEWIDKVGKKAAGRLLDGILHNDYPMEVPL